MSRQPNPLSPDTSPPMPGRRKQLMATPAKRRLGEGVAPFRNSIVIATQSGWKAFAWKTEIILPPVIIRMHNPINMPSSLDHHA